MVNAGADAYAEHLAQFLGGERSERFKGDGEVGADLEADIEYGAGALHIGLCDLPRLGVGDILVARAGD